MRTNTIMEKIDELKESMAEIKSMKDEIVELRKQVGELVGLGDRTYDEPDYETIKAEVEQGIKSYEWLDFYKRLATIQSLNQQLNTYNEASIKVFDCINEEGLSLDDIDYVKDVYSSRGYDVSLVDIYGSKTICYVIMNVKVKRY